MQPPAWHWARDAIRLKRERGVRYRDWPAAHHARLELLPRWVDPRRGLVVDLGANRGDWTAAIVSALPSARILAVEPNPPTFRELAARFEDNERVRLEKRAVGAASGEALFHQTTNDVFGSLLEPEPALDSLYGAGSRSVGTITVPVVTLDEMIGNESVSLMKIDVQGAEVQVFEGAERTLGIAQAVQIEANFAVQYQGGSQLSDIDAALTAHGFVLWDLTRLSRAGDGRLVWADAIYVRPV